MREILLAVCVLEYSKPYKGKQLKTEKKRIVQIKVLINNSQSSAEEVKLFLQWSDSGVSPGLIKWPPTRDTIEKVKAADMMLTKSLLPALFNSIMWQVRYRR